MNYSSLRVTIYKTLSTWLQITGSANHLTGEELDELLQELFNDIQPQQNRLKVSNLPIFVSVHVDRSKVLKRIIPLYSGWTSTNYLFPFYSGWTSNN